MRRSGDLPATRGPQPPPLVDRTPLLGREVEVATAGRLLLRDEGGLLTLTGPGGVGKTRLALRLAAALGELFVDGVWFVALAPVRDPALLAPTIARALGVKDVAGQLLPTTLAAALRDRQVLLVLDSCEHLPAAATLVGDLLTACAQLTVLATSRAALRLTAEQVYPVPPLALPGPEATLSCATALRSPAVALFVARAQAVQPDYALTDASAPVVAAICRRLDGLPLAIELAAARARLLPPVALLARLERRLPLLTDGARDLPVRQRTLRQTIDWSYDLLDAGGRALLARLAVFAGGATLAAIEGVCAGADVPPPDDAWTVLDGVETLVGQHLVRRWEGHDGEPRFGMLETIGEYAAERLAASGDVEAVQRRHAAFYLALAEAAEPQLWGAPQGPWLARLDEEHDNLRAALGRALAAGDGATALRLAGALWRFWLIHGYLSEGRRWLARALASGAAPAAARARALRGAGALALFQGDFPSGTDAVERSLGLFRELGDTTQVAEALNNLGMAVGMAGDHARAKRHYEASLTLFRELRDTRGTAMVLTNLARTALGQGDLRRAAALTEEGLRLARALGDPRGVGYNLQHLAAVALEQGEHRRAAALFEESLALFAGVRNSEAVAAALEGLASVASAQGHLQRAARLWRTAAALREAIGAPLPPGDRARVERYLAAVRPLLDSAAALAPGAAGPALTLEEAVALARRDEAIPRLPAALPDPRTVVAPLRAAPRAPAPGHPAGLTPREVEILRLVAAGRSNHVIADRLALSRRTVERHVANIYIKIGAHNKADATAYALRHGLLVPAST